MGELLSTVVQIISSYVTRVLDRRAVSQDAKVGADLLGVVLTLQELCLNGERLLTLADTLISGGEPRADDQSEFAALLHRQSTLINQLRRSIDGSRALLATVDVDFAFAMAPFLDGKSGLLTRWQQQAALSQFSTTTLFFLPAEAVTRVVADSPAAFTATTLDRNRTDFVLVVANEVRNARRREAPDIRAVADDERETLLREVAHARSEIENARVLCGQLLTATQQAIGADATAQLRRTLTDRR
ncbi:hypothetical protein [Micromonospora sp. WMMD1155]|uniref:hypothetical protein n=1 Tax=Micromonospora sp. WMMD1155 TaxID=3016094 RepID=UPI00249B02E2|nr:hypothetical protein [Micromonospora sp. WMMD1155]WFE50608.1 hypothetical protein O7617_09845 [Micromonospora sp. WMMD1155]